MAAPRSAAMNVLASFLVVLVAVSCSVHAREITGAGVSVVSSYHEGYMESFNGPREKLCAACTEAVQQVQTVLADPDAIAEMEAIAEGTVCQQLPGELAQECAAAIEQYVPVIVSELQAYVTVDNVCVKFDICPPTPAPPLLLAGVAAGSHPQLNNAEECFACRLVLKLLRKRLSEPATQAKIENYLELKCANMGNTTVAKECEAAVDKYLPLVFANIDKILDDKRLCKEAELCNAARALV